MSLFLFAKLILPNLTLNPCFDMAVSPLASDTAILPSRSGGYAKSPQRAKRCGLLVFCGLQFDESHEYRCRLCAGRGGGWAYHTVLVALDDALGDGPAHGLIGPAADRVGVLRGEQEVHRRLALEAPEHRHELLAGHSAHRVRAVAHALGHRPLLSLGVPARAAVGVHTVEAGQHRPDHRSVERGVRRELRGGDAVHQLMLPGVLHRVVVPRACGDVVEREHVHIRLVVGHIGRARRDVGHIGPDGLKAGVAGDSDLVAGAGKSRRQHRASP